jgi:hypothetical protein
MFMRHATGVKRFFVVLLVALPAGMPEQARAQTVQVFAEGLRSPSRLLAHEDPAFVLVAESGLRQANLGRVSMVDRHGARCTVIDGLPSSIAAGEPSGPAGLLLFGHRLYIVIGAGNAVMPGPSAGSELPNPAVASPLFSSVLSLEFEADEDVPTCGFAITPDDHRALAAGQELRLRGERGDARLRVVANFPDFVSEPRPDVPGNVRVSNPFGLVGTAAQLEVVDASRNLIWRVFVPTGEFAPLVSFPQVANTGAVGAPLVDAVPAGIRWYGDDLIVSLLTGFPFGPGAASLRVVNRQDGSARQLIGGLQTAVDVLPIDYRHGPLYVIEMSPALAQRTPGRILRCDTPDSPPLVVASGLPTPPCLAQEPWGRDLLVTDFTGGRLLRVLTPR